jgi:hypothetical protein
MGFTSSDALGFEKTRMRAIADARVFVKRRRSKD